MPANFDSKGNIIIDKNVKFDELGRPIDTVFTFQSIDTNKEDLKLDYSKELESIQSAKRILISEMNNAVDRGFTERRQEILREIFILNNREKQLTETHSSFSQKIISSKNYVEKEIEWINEEIVFLKSFALKLGYNKISQEIELLERRKEILNSTI